MPCWQLFWARHYIRDTWRKTFQANANTIRSKNFANCNVELVQMLSRCGHGIAYTQIEEINTVLCLQKMVLTSDNDVPLNLPKNIQATLAWDNIDRIEGTLNISSSKCHSCLSQAFWSRNLLPPPGTEQARMSIKHTLQVDRECSCSEGISIFVL